MSVTKHGAPATAWLSDQGFICCFSAAVTIVVKNTMVANMLKGRVKTPLNRFLCVYVCYSVCICLTVCVVVFLLLLLLKLSLNKLKPVAEWKETCRSGHHSQ